MASTDSDEREVGEPCARPEIRATGGNRSRLALRNGQESGSPVVAFAFGGTVAMWAVGYVCRLPLVMAPAAVLLVGLLLAQLGAGIAFGRYVGGARRGALAGALSGVLNLLILGALLSDLRRSPGDVPPVLLWLPGSIGVGAALGGLGAALGGRFPDHRPDRSWQFGLACVAVTATSLLIVAGGLVTGHDAGLAVPDWPTSFESNMFLYPLSRMTGGIYFEHAHRLFGTLVGLTTIVLAVTVRAADGRRWLRWLAAAAVAAVVLQGVMGGYRVTLAKVGQGIELSTMQDETTVSAVLRVAHGVFGQVVLGLLTSIAAFSSRGWRSLVPTASPAARSARRLAVLLVAGLLLQLVLGAVLRHVQLLLFAHITFAAVVLGLAVFSGMRAWTRAGDVDFLRTVGRWLVFGALLQLSLGLIALVATGSPTVRLVVDALLSTMHQGVGAALLAMSVALGVWTFGALAPVEKTAASA